MLEKINTRLKDKISEGIKSFSKSSSLNEKKSDAAAMDNKTTGITLSNLMERYGSGEPVKVNQVHFNENVEIKNLNKIYEQILSLSKSAKKILSVQVDSEINIENIAKILKIVETTETQLAKKLNQIYKHVSIERAMEVTFIGRKAKEQLVEIKKITTKGSKDAHKNKIKTSLRVKAVKEYFELLKDEYHDNESNA